MRGDISRRPNTWQESFPRKRSFVVNTRLAPDLYELEVLGENLAHCVWTMETRQHPPVHGLPRAFPLTIPRDIRRKVFLWKGLLQKLNDNGED
jgi:hypothetical protein